MIKAGGKTKQGNDLLLLGLSGENVTRLVAGEPIHVSTDDMTELGLPPMVILVHYGRTEEDILAEMRSFGMEMVEKS